MRPETRYHIEKMVKSDRNVFPSTKFGVSKGSQLAHYIRETAQREAFWDADMLDLYARLGEDYLKNPLHRIFAHDLYKQRVATFRAMADEKFCNEFGYTLQRRIEDVSN